MTDIGVACGTCGGDVVFETCGRCGQEWVVFSTCEECGAMYSVPCPVCDPLRSAPSPDATKSQVRRIALQAEDESQLSTLTDSESSVRTGEEEAT